MPAIKSFNKENRVRKCYDKQITEKIPGENRISIQVIKNLIKQMQSGVTIMDHDVIAIYRYFSISSNISQ